MSEEIQLRAVLTPVKGKDAYRVGIEPPHDWHKLALFMEATGVLANSFVGDNPKGIDNSEEMADYCADYITKVVMGAEK